MSAQSFAASARLVCSYWRRSCAFARSRSLNSRVRPISGQLQGIDMDVNVLCLCPQHAMLVPAGLAHPKHISGGKKCRQIRGLVSGILDHHQHVDDRLGAKPGHRCRADMLDTQGRVAKRAADNGAVALKRHGPLRIVRRDCDLALFAAPDQPDLGFAVLSRARLLSVNTGVSATLSRKTQAPIVWSGQNAL